jgi:hypothetical protein
VIVTVMSHFDRLLKAMAADPNLRHSGQTTIKHQTKPVSQIVAIHELAKVSLQAITSGVPSGALPP